MFGPQIFTRSFPYPLEIKAEFIHMNFNYRTIITENHIPIHLGWNSIYFRNKCTTRQPNNNYHFKCKSDLDGVFVRTPPKQQIINRWWVSNKSCRWRFTQQRTCLDRSEWQNFPPLIKYRSVGRLKINPRCARVIC